MYEKCTVQLAIVGLAHTHPNYGGKEDETVLNIDLCSEDTPHLFVHQPSPPTKRSLVEEH